jgi:hypothetical protein
MIPSGPSLPQELQDSIIAFIPSKETELLKVTSLVCRAWVLPSRTHLFRVIYLMDYLSPQYAPDRYDYLPSDDKEYWVALRCIPKLIYMMMHPALAYHVQDLEVLSLPSIVDANTLAGLIHRTFPRLKSALMFLTYGINIPKLMNDAQVFLNSLLPNLPHLETFRLGSNAFTAAHDITQWWPTFHPSPKLRHLVLSSRTQEILQVIISCIIAWPLQNLRMLNSLKLEPTSHLTMTLDGLHKLHECYRSLELIPCLDKLVLSFPYPSLGPCLTLPGTPNRRTFFSTIPEQHSQICTCAIALLHDLPYISHSMRGFSLCSAHCSQVHTFQSCVSWQLEPARPGRLRLVSPEHCTYL